MVNNNRLIKMARPLRSICVSESNFPLDCCSRHVADSSLKSDPKYRQGSIKESVNGSLNESLSVNLVQLDGFGNRPPMPALLRVLLRGEVQ